EGAGVPEGVLLLLGQLRPKRVHELAERLVQGDDLVDRAPLDEVGEHGQRGLGDRAALADPADGVEARATLTLGEPDPQRDLVPAGGVHLEGLRVVGVELPGAVPLTGVVEYDLLVELFQRVSHGSPRRTAGPCRARRGTRQSPPRW